MKKLVVTVIALISFMPLIVLAQIEYFQYDTTATDTFEFWARTPIGFNPANPPAILVWWHGYGANSQELRNYTQFGTLCDEYGWLAVSSRGPIDGKHYQNTRGQAHVQRMLDWTMSFAPFSMDSIYMGGSSMGAAGGQVWHNNNCGIHDYMPAAVFGGSPILDCELRQQQYVDSGHTLDAMRADFGGFPWDSDSIAYEYHRASAVRLPDTTKSMHFNALHLPVYNTWGISDGCWNCEWFAYGRPAQRLDTLRRACNADTTVTFCSGIDGHGCNVLYDDSVMMWLSHFSVNRYPSDLSINADQDDEYYWTKVRLDTLSYTMGRYGVTRDFTTRRLDINAVRNIAGLEVEFAFPWPTFDSLWGTWFNYDSVRVPRVEISLTGVAGVREVRGPDGANIPFSSHGDTLDLSLNHSGNYVVKFIATSADPRNVQLTGSWKMSAAYPDPFNPTTIIEYELPKASDISLRVFDVLGREVAVLKEGFVEAGKYRAVFDGSRLASGIYFARFDSKDFSQTRKLMLLK